MVFLLVVVRCFMLGHLTLSRLLDVARSGSGDDVC